MSGGDGDASFVGCLLGTAVGDALGLPYEGLSPRRALRLLGVPSRHRLLFGRGMISDDTEHASMVAQALLVAGDDANAFARDFARRLRWWLLAVPAGTGLATLRAGVRSWLGVPPARSGVWSAGNGAAMRSALLGLWARDLAQLRELVRAATLVTHRDPRAEHGAAAVAFAARSAANTSGPIDGVRWLDELRAWLGGDARELLAALDVAVASASRGEATRAFAAAQGWSRGVSGFVLHSVPIALHAWLRHQTDFGAAVRAAIECGGDADTTAAITGAIVGARVGRDGIPVELLCSVRDWPRSIDWLQRLAVALHAARGGTPCERIPRLPVLGVLARNVAFLAIVLAHGLRRLLPPY